MSPEQVSGETADARSDIFSLGCVLYEMLSGRRAFGGTTPGQTLAAILRDQPPEISRSGVELPHGLDRMVRALPGKNPNERFQTARDLAYALKEIRGASVTASAVGMAPGLLRRPRRRRFPRPARGSGPGRSGAMLVVIAAAALLLRLRGGAPEPGAAACASGIRRPDAIAGGPPVGEPDGRCEPGGPGRRDHRTTDARPGQAGRPPGDLSVVRDGVQGHDEAFAQIARELNVDGIVKGSVTRAGGKVQVKAQLVNATTNDLWADSFEREALDVSALQNDVTSAIAKQVGIAFRPPDQCQPRNVAQDRAGGLRGVHPGPSLLESGQVRPGARALSEGHRFGTGVSRGLRWPWRRLRAPRL